MLSVITFNRLQLPKAQQFCQKLTQARLNRQALFILFDEFHITEGVGKFGLFEVVCLLKKHFSASILFTCKLRMFISQHSGQWQQYDYFSLQLNLRDKLSSQSIKFAYQVSQNNCVHNLPVLMEGCSAGIKQFFYIEKVFKH